MQTRFKDGTVMVVGGCSKDAELEHVGQDSKRICKVGLAAGKREDGTTIWVNVVAWHETAEVLSTAMKGQQVLVIGHLKQREYNGKTYTDLVADYVSVCAPTAKSSVDYATPAPGAQFDEIDGPDDQLPF